MKKVSVVVLLMFSFIAFSQSQLDVKYLIIPNKFKFQHQENQYGLNDLAKLYFESKGYTCLNDKDVLPDEVAKNNCLPMYFDIVENNTMFLTKITLELKSCNNTILAKSLEGVSRDKELNTAYKVAFRQAIYSLDIQSAEMNKFKNMDVTKVVATKTAVVNPIVSNEMIPSNSGHLFAQPTQNGYQLVDSTPKIVMNLIATSNPSIFIVQRSTTNGVVYKKEAEWVYEYVENNILVSELLKIKF